MKTKNADITVVVTGMKRTAIIPKAQKTFADTPAHALMYFSAEESIKSMKAAALEEVVAGTCFHDPSYMNVARVVTMLLGVLKKDALAFLKDGVPLNDVTLERSWTLDVPAYTMSENCGSGNLPLVAGYDAIRSGRIGLMLAVAGESMSNIPFMLPRSMMNGNSLGDKILLDGMMHGLTDPFTGKMMGYTADEVAMRYGITRTEQDAYVERSHRLANQAVQSGVLDEQIAPVTIWERKSEIEVVQDAGFNPTLTAQSIAGLKPYFGHSHGVVTAVASSQISDGAASMLLGSLSRMDELGMVPEAELLSFALTGCDPRVMGMGPVSAIQKALALAGLTLDQIDVFQVNEAFAVTTLAVQKVLKIPLEKLNPYGGALALGGHPVGATALILPVIGINILKDWGKKYLVVAGCVGGGQGYASVWKLWQ